MKILGIDFAPLNIPLERRLQTLATLYTASIFLFSEVLGICLFVYILFFTKYYYFSILYAVWIWLDSDTCHRGGRHRFHWHRNLSLWKKTRDYFPVQLIKTAELDASKNYIIGYHPHGVMCIGAVCAFGTEANGIGKEFPGITVTGVTLAAHFKIPFAREYLLFAGVSASSPRNFHHVFTRQGTGNAILLVVGGSAETMDAHPHQAVLTLKNRKGFVKLALRYGAHLVPVYAFGENDLYSQVPNPEGSLVRKIQTKFKDCFGIPLYLINGRGIFQYTFGIMPHRRPIYVVVGKPIEVEKVDNPSDQLINDYHAKYVESLTLLFNEYKMKLGSDYKDLVLKLI